MNMFKSTSATTPEEYLELLEEPRKTEITEIYQFIKKTLPKLDPYIMSGMICFGKYRYRYASGREGDWCLVALANQKNYISIYACAVSGDKYIAEEYKDKLPKASIGKSCIRFKKTADIDFVILKEILLQTIKLGGVSAVADK